MTRVRLFVTILVTLLIGIVIGGYLFSDSRPRSFLALRNCEGTCLKPNELVGLAGSVGLQKFSAPGLTVVKETEKTIVFDQPGQHAGTHYLIVPKKDLKNIADVPAEDLPYLDDAMQVAGELIREKKLYDYSLSTNGPGYQTLTYLHFHLIAR
jgi:hypothetical protein